MTSHLFAPWQAAWDYWVDAAQRTILSWDVTVIYSSPWLQAALGLRADGHGATDERAIRDETFEALVALRAAALRTRLDEGGVREARRARLARVEEILKAAPIAATPVS